MAGNNEVLVSFKGKDDGLGKESKTQKENIKGVGDESKKTDDQITKTGDSGSVAGQKISSGFKIGAAAVAAAAVAASALVGKLAKDSIQAYADYEQLSGGVDKLFGGAADAVKASADTAYKTAGMSANAYMENVTGFSASLISGLKGNTTKAAELANVAISDMSDNANTYGTDMDSIQRTYQGFAKSQFGMLDNLKLGYGGSASEMARLINDSKVLGDTQVTAANVSEVSMDKIIQAVHKTQETMGIAGTTAKEAASTISGSLASTQAAWTNVMASFGTGSDMAIEKAVNGLIESAGNFVSNISKILPDVLGGVTSLITTLVSMIPDLLADLLPAFIDGVVRVINGLVAAIPDLLGVLTEIIPTLVQGFVKIFLSIVDALPEIIKGFLALFTALATALLDPKLLKKVIKSLAKAVIGIVQAIAEFIKDPTALSAILEGAFTLFMEIIKALPDIIIALVAALPDIIDGLVKFLTDGKNVAMIAKAALILFIGVVPVVIAMLLKKFLDLIPGLGKVWETIVNALKTFFAQIPAAFMTVMNAIKTAAMAVWNFIWLNIIKPVIDFIVGYFTFLYNTWVTIITAIKDAAQAIWSWIWNNIIKPVIDLVVAYFTFLKDTWTTIITTIKDVAVSIWETIKNTITGVVDKVKAVWNGIVEWFKDKWDKIKEGATAIKDGIVGAVKGAFETAKETVKKGINWIIKKINLIIKGFNTVAGKIPGISIEIPEIPELAGGGIVYGPGTSTSDSIPAMLSSGEAVLKASAVKSLGVDAIALLNEGRLPQSQGPIVGEINHYQDADPLALAQQIGAMVRFA